MGSLFCDWVCAMQIQICLYGCCGCWWWWLLFNSNGCCFFSFFHSFLILWICTKKNLFFYLTPSTFYPSRTFAHSTISTLEFNLLYFLHIFHKLGKKRVTIKFIGFFVCLFLFCVCMLQWREHIQYGILYKFYSILLCLFFLIFFMRFIWQRMSASSPLSKKTNNKLIN